MLCVVCDGFITAENVRFVWPKAHLGVFVEVHAGLRGDVLGADDLTVSLKGLELEELGCREEL